MQKVVIVCGVSGSGKSWVCKQLTDKFHYVPNDEHYNDHVPAIVRAAQTATKPVITDCPFGERILKESLQKMGIQVVPYFVIEDPRLVARRYMDRERKPLPKAAHTRATTIKDRAIEWGAARGTSQEVLTMLRKAVI